MEEIRVTVSNFPPEEMQPPVLVTRSRFAKWMDVLRNLILNPIKVTINILTSLTKKRVPENNYPPVEMKQPVLVTRNPRPVCRSDGYLDEFDPNPNQSYYMYELPLHKDRASVVKHALVYIKELLRLIEELKVLVERNKAQRQSDFAEFDVQVVKDEVTIKVVQKIKEINCLLFVSKVIDQLQLQLQDVAGEEHTFLFKAKTYEGSCVHANVIADILVEVGEKEYMDALSTQF